MTLTSLFDRANVRVESLIVLAGLLVLMSLLSPVFLSFSNFFNIMLATTTVGILAIGATFVISAAGIDLSLGSVLGLSSVRRWCCILACHGHS